MCHDLLQIVNVEQISDPLYTTSTTTTTTTTTSIAQL